MLRRRKVINPDVLRESIDGVRYLADDL